MTDAQASELIGVVKAAVRQMAPNHPELDDMIGEGILRAYQVIDRAPPGYWQRWPAIAWRLARWQAKEYLRSHRSGRLNPCHHHEPDYPVLMDDLSREMTTDGGINAADARLQLLLLQVPLPMPPPPVVRCCHQCGRSLLGKRPQAIYCAPSCNWKAKGQRRKAQNAPRADSSPVESQG